MNKASYFPLRENIFPKIYAYVDLKDPDTKGLIKIGETTQDVLKRVKEQYPIYKPGEIPFKIIFNESSIRSDGTVFRDKDILKLLKSKNYFVDHEWAKVTLNELKSAYIAVRDRTDLDISRNLDFKMRPEQEEAVIKTISYIKDFKKDNPSSNIKFLWNAKMRFGKTFAAYQLVKKMKWKKVLILTFQPAVQAAWQDDLIRHIDFKDWQFLTKINSKLKKDDKPIACFGSFQDFLGKNKLGGIKPLNRWVHEINWDCIIYDEYHYGAWREKAKELVDTIDLEEKNEKKFIEGEGRNYFEHELMPITGNFHLYLSGTPFRAITNGEFIEEQIYNWTYIDEQKAKLSWKKDKNPYAPLPTIKLLTYTLPSEVVEILDKGEFNEFDLNTFFKAKGKGTNAKFIYEDHVQKWLDFIRGSLNTSSYNNLKSNFTNVPLPYSDTNLLSSLTHTFWFLPNVASCEAMFNLLKNNHNKFYHQYELILAAGSKAGNGVKALGPVLKAMKNPMESKTITLSCRKLHSGVSVPPWTGIFMLKNLNSPEMYFQTAFRVQTPWVISNNDIKNDYRIIKKEGYIFDFAPQRALRRLSDYACKLNPEEQDEEKKVQEFIKFLPVLAYEGGQLKTIDAAGVLERAMSGTSATLLAKKWASSDIINVDNLTLEKLLSDKDAMKFLSKIEAFRNINDEIEVIINSSKKIHKIKKDNENETSKKNKKKLSEEEKVFRKNRDELAKKLKKLASRIPLFMYLTDFREKTLKDVIRELEPDLFNKVTGLTKKQFDKLISIGVFNSNIMNTAVGDFKRYEDMSLSYSGVYRHEGLSVGLWETVLTQEEFRERFPNK